MYLFKKTEYETSKFKRYFFKFGRYNRENIDIAWCFPDNILTYIMDG